LRRVHGHGDVMDQEAKYWRDKWKDEVKVNIQLRQDLLSMQDAQRAVKADRETIKRLKGKKTTK
jgi:hypothetical protein